MTARYRCFTASHLDPTSNSIARRASVAYCTISDQGRPAMDMDVTFSVLVLAGLGGMVYMMRQRGLNQRALGRLADSVDRMRALADRETKRQPVPADAVSKMPGSGYYDAATREIQTAGGRVLGDLAEVYPDGTLTQPARWFVDGTGTVAGWYAIVGPAQAPAVRQVMFLMSEAPGGEFFTTSRGGGGTSTATSPRHHRAECQWTDGLARQLEIHRGQVPAALSGALTHVATLDDATGLFARARQAKIDWRAKQPADALLDQDLRQILQDRYPAVGTQLMAYMRRRGAAGTG
jgi:hypothetical protein